MNSSADSEVYGSIPDGFLILIIHMDIQILRLWVILFSGRFRIKFCFFKVSEHLYYFTVYQTKSPAGIVTVNSTL